MDNLPDELLGMICSHCNKLELKSLRLVSRTTLKAANECLLPEIVVFMNRESLESCKGIAAHPVFSRTARNLWIQADRPRRTSFSEWDAARKRQFVDLESIKTATDVVYASQSGIKKGDRQAAMLAIVQELQAKANLEVATWSKEQCESLYAKVLRITSEAEEIFYDHSLSTCFRNIFTRCPNVDSVEITLANSIRRGTIEENEAFKRSGARAFGDMDPETPGVDALTQLVSAALAVEFRPRVLKLGDVSHYAFMRKALSDQLKILFTDLEELTWKFTIPYLDDDEIDSEGFDETVQDFALPGKFVSLLEGAPKLRKLDLELPFSYQADELIMLAWVVGDVTWPLLVHVQLLNFDTTHADLSGFLLRHKDTLTSVCIGEVHLLDSGAGEESQDRWSDCFLSFAGKLPKVQEFDLRGKFYANWKEFYNFGDLEQNANNRYGRAVSEFLIAGGDQLPEFPEREESDGWLDDDEDDVLQPAVGDDAENDENVDPDV
ncbi:hypothetical protein TI39_contig671g00002 [Zymoseptoria brevis]|uniref:F-box domain-containing protein n=1 Tax=Zymoseptoria brevis TaxID=1047168 RepID=A0A0F4GGC2_9PEZI|nr:hypothetical protein TI39_contig671g00002 [Zymoseptoria brevis]